MVYNQLGSQLLVEMDHLQLIQKLAEELVQPENQEMVGLGLGLASHPGLRQGHIQRIMGLGEEVIRRRVE